MPRLNALEILIRNSTGKHSKSIKTLRKILKTNSKNELFDGSLCLDAELPCIPNIDIYRVNIQMMPHMGSQINSMFRCVVTKMAKVWSLSGVTAHVSV